MDTRPLPTLPRPVAIDNDDYNECNDSMTDDDTHLLLLPSKAPPKRGPTYIFVFAGASKCFSVGVLGLLAASCYMVSGMPTVPFEDPHWKDDMSWRQGHLGLYLSGVPLLGVLFFLNIGAILWNWFNTNIAAKGRHLVFTAPNIVADFLIWATQLGFAIPSFLFVLWDREPCHDDELDLCGYQNTSLYIEIAALTLCLLVAVTHFILLVTRCCLELPQVLAGAHLKLGSEVEDRVALLSRSPETRIPPSPLQPLPTDTSAPGSFQAAAAAGWDRQSAHQEQQRQQTQQDTIRLNVAKPGNLQKPLPTLPDSVSTSSPHGMVAVAPTPVAAAQLEVASEDAVAAGEEQASDSSNNLIDL